MVRDRSAHDAASVLPVVVGSGQVTGPGGLSCAGATCPATDVSAGPVALTAAPAAGWIVLSWSVEGVDAADVCGIAHTTCTVTVAATRAATVTVRFAPALPTVLHAGVKAYACNHRVEVVSPTVRPALDTAHPFLGTLTISLKLPSGKKLCAQTHASQRLLLIARLLQAQARKDLYRHAHVLGGRMAPCEVLVEASQAGRC